MRRISTYICLLAVLSVAACTSADGRASGTEAAVAQPVNASLGIILSVRTVTTLDGGSVLQAALLADAGGAATPGNGGGRPITEFIVRQDDGAIISVVQSNVLGFHAGDRVSIQRADRVRLARPR